MKATREWFSQILTDLGEEHTQLVVVDADLAPPPVQPALGNVFPNVSISAVSPKPTLWVLPPVWPKRVFVPW